MVRADATRWNSSEHARKFVCVRFGEGKSGPVGETLQVRHFLPDGFCRVAPPVIDTSPRSTKKCVSQIKQDIAGDSFQ